MQMPYPDAGNPVEPMETKVAENGYHNAWYRNS